MYRISEMRPQVPGIIKQHKNSRDGSLGPFLLFFYSDRFKRYDDIKQKADKVVYTSQEYTRGCMHKRNRHLVDNSSACISYLTENKGGTFYTVNYAKSKGVEVINIAE